MTDSLSDQSGQNTTTTYTEALAVADNVFVDSTLTVLGQSFGIAVLGSVTSTHQTLCRLRDCIASGASGIVGANTEPEAFAFAGGTVVAMLRIAFGESLGDALGTMAEFSAETLAPVRDFIRNGSEAMGADCGAQSIAGNLADLFPGVQGTEEREAFCAAMKLAIESAEPVPVLPARPRRRRGWLTRLDAALGDDPNVRRN